MKLHFINIIALFILGAELYSADGPDTQTYSIPSQNGFIALFGTKKPGSTMVVNVVADPGCRIVSARVTGGDPVWKGGPTFTGSIPNNWAGNHIGKFGGEYSCGQGGEGDGGGSLPEWSGTAAARACRFKRTDNPPSDLSSFKPTGKMWKLDPASQEFIADPLTKDHTFKLKYEPGSEDCLDGQWEHVYVLQSRASDTVTSSDTSNILDAGGALYAVAYKIYVDGNEVFTGGAGVDSRSKGSVGSIVIPLGDDGGKLNIDLSTGSSGSAVVNVSGDWDVGVSKESKEQAALSHEVDVLVVGQSKLVFAGSARWGNHGKGVIKWKDSSVLEAHFHE